ncbi:MAG: hypothetical protein HQL73_08610 [Magnetococcales bacterium]|nr:hypothetical protein [Magnetococcales bacterium]
MTLSEDVSATTPLQANRWDCRWPDPVALKVATDRIFGAMAVDDPSLNRRLGIIVRMEPPMLDSDPVSAILVTPWAVERVFWHNNREQKDPPILHAGELETTPDGRVAAGQGVVLETSQRTFPVVIAWEPETGHHFVQTLLHEVHEFNSVEAAIRAAFAGKTRPRLTQVTLNKEVSRRGLFSLGGWFGRGEG